MNNNKPGKTRLIRRVFISFFFLLVLAFTGVFILFRDELKIINSIEQLSTEDSIYYMEFDGDYHFEEFLETGGAASDEEVSAFLTSQISKGFYSVDVKETELACSTISATTPEGTHVWGRNYDWTGSVPIIVRHTPEVGYSSISTSDFQIVTSDSEVGPEGFANKMLAIAALYVPLDGINEAGLCVADLEVNEGGMTSIDTDKPDLTITTAVRLLLNKAATVDEAIDLLSQYDVHASASISHHLAISDATGASVVIEFINGDQIAINTNIVTNFNLANGDPTAGGENSKQRFDQLNTLISENKSILSSDQVKQALEQVSQTSGVQTTQWSIVYDHDSLTADFYFNRDFDTPYSFSLTDD